MSIGQVIKVVREERGLTQSQFAHELFVTQQALSRWEKGTAEPSIDMIRLISTRFEVPLLPNLKRWRRQDEIDAVAEGK